MATNYKKYLAATIATTVAASAAVTVIPNNTEAAGALKDLDKDAYFYNAVVALNTQGVIKGYEDGTFKHSLNVTRGQVAAMIARALKIDKKQVADPGFKDVKKGDRFYNEIAAIFDAGIVDGVTAEKFEPNRDITRAEMSKIIAIAFKLKVDNGYSNKFTDVPKNSWYAEYVEALFDTGVTLGKTKTSYAPAEKVNRGQMAAFIYRAMNYEAPPVGGGGGGGWSGPVNQPPVLEAVTLTIGGQNFSVNNVNGVWKTTVTQAQLDSLQGTMFTAIDFEASEKSTGIIKIAGQEYTVEFDQKGQTESTLVSAILGEKDPDQNGVSVGKLLTFLKDHGQKLNHAIVTVDDLKFTVDKLASGDWEISLDGFDDTQESYDINVGVEKEGKETITVNGKIPHVDVEFTEGESTLGYKGEIQGIEATLQQLNLDTSQIDGTVGFFKDLLGNDKTTKIEATLSDGQKQSTVTIDVTDKGFQQ